MTKEQIKEQFPEATDEQISALLAINGTDVTEASKNNVDPKVLKQLREDSEAYKKLQEADLTDAEKIQKALDDAATSKKDYEKKLNKLDAEKILVAAGLTEEDYKGLIDGIVSDDAESTKTMATNLANLIKNQKDSAIKKTREELMDGTNTPGGSGGGSGEEKSEDVKFAEEIAGSFKVDAKATGDVFANY